VYVLIRRARQGSGLVTDLVPGQSGGGKGKGRLPESVERIIRELLQKRFLTKQKRSLAAFHREVAQACKAQKLRVPARNTVACGSPASIRARPLAAGKARMRP
jgi:putative transposase